ncbi:unnamed protein product, partial [Adineta steineri]
MFEDLPDEILIIIFQYSGDPYTILRTYLGLNQRINRILIDKHLHLLTNFLYTKYNSDYYDSEIFQNASQQLLMINSNIDKTKLDEIFRPLIPFHIRQIYIQQGQEFQLLTEQHNSIRQNLSNNEKRQVDCEVKIQFSNLNKLDRSIETFQNIKRLVLKQGARCECEDGPGYFNLISAVQRFLLLYIDSRPNFVSSISPHLLAQTFKALIISNNSLLNNRDYVGYMGGCMATWKLIDITVFSISRLKCCFSKRNSSTPVNMKYYHEIVYLYLFIIQCQKQTPDEQEKNMYLMLDFISNMDDNLLIELTNMELLKMIVEETVFNDTTDNDWLETSLRRTIKNVVKAKQFNVIVYLAQSERIPWKKTFNEPNHIRKFINSIMHDQSGRRFLLQIMKTTSKDFLSSKKEFFFILLEKRERKLLEQVLQSSPEFLNELDEDENDALLYTCLKVSGLRHRIIELLIKMGSNMERRNSQGLNFMDTLELPRNRSLS